MSHEEKCRLQPVQILKRPKPVAQCLSCRGGFSSTSELASHLRVLTSGPRCSRTEAPAVVGCYGCKTSSTQLEKLVLHLEDLSSHAPFEAKPTGRAVFVGGFGTGVAERDIKKFFDGFIIETTSMLTHRDANEKFAFVEFSTREEVDRAVGSLHGKDIFGRRVVVQPPRPNRNQQAAHQFPQLEVKERTTASQSETKQNSNNSPAKIKQKAKMQRQDVQAEQSGQQPAGRTSTSSTPLRGSAARFHPRGSYAAAQSVEVTQAERNQWTTFGQGDIPQAWAALLNNVHDTSRLFEAGYNITTPTMPQRSELRARLKCRYCRGTRRNNDSRIIKICPKSPDNKHFYGGIEHLVSRCAGFAQTPMQTPLFAKRVAVALDCEMAGGWAGDGFVDNVIQLTAVDYLTGETLISALVAPTHPIRQWRTAIHGVGYNDMQAAIFCGAALAGWEGARAALFAHIDDATILVGHALHNDLNILRVVHTRVVDSEILAHGAIGLPSAKHRALKSLCRELIGTAIQQRSHDCLEDTLAAREVVLRMTMHPESFAVWGNATRAREEERLRQRAEAEIAVAMAEADAARSWEM